MNQEEARQMLIASLTKVRQQMDSGADDWRYSLMDVFKQYCLKIGIGRPFIDPIIQIYFEAHRDITEARRRADGAKGRPLMPEGRRAALILTSAAVTVLVERKVAVPDALRDVGQASQIDQEKIGSFRDELHRLKYGAEVEQAYQNAIKAVRSWPPEIMLDGLSGLGAFVP